MLISIIINITFIILISVWIISMYKKCNGFVERIFYVIAVFIIVLVNCLYYLDRYNVPTLLKWGISVNTQNWLNHLITIGSTLGAQVISGVILLLITRMQIDENNKSNQKRDEEQRIINNMPLLTYSFQDYSSNIEYNKKYELKSVSNSDEYYFTLSVKNIGMNSVRKCVIKVSSDLLVESYECKLDEQSTLNKNEEKRIIFETALLEGESNYNLLVYYEDLLHNWYSQKIDLIIDSKKTEGYFRDITYNCKVHNERKISKPNTITI